MCILHVTRTKDKSIKGGERQARGASERYVITSPDMKVPYNFANFLKNGDNKAMLFNLIQRAIEEDKSKLQGRTIFFSNKYHCTNVSADQITIAGRLESNHEEADTKLIAFVQAANVATGDCVMVRSPSGDIDILALFVAHDFGGVQVLIDNGTGLSRKIMDVTSSSLDIEKRRALIGLHAFSGNDYVSSFFRKGKIAFWKRMAKKAEYVNLFANLGTTLFVSEEVEGRLEQFVCAMYGNERMKSVNDVRKKIFLQKFENENKITDLSLLPPCQSNLKLHIKRSNYVASIFRQAGCLMMDLDDPANHGWDESGSVAWSDKCYPDDVTELLLSNENENGDDDDDADLLQGHDSDNDFDEEIVDIFYA